MKNILLHTLHFRRATLLLALATAAGATLADGPENWQQKLEKRGYAVTEETAEIQNYRLNGWNYLDSRHLIINSGVSDRYLVTFRNRCTDLSSSETIAFSNTANRLTRFDKAIVRGAGGIKQDCYIETIHKLKKL